MADGTSAVSAPPGPPPFINEAIQQKVRWRDGDVVVAVPPKSGTTWTMNIVHQLRSAGDASFADIYREVPWLELVPGPGRDVDQLAAEIDAMSAERRRAFKTHAAPPTLPYQAPGTGHDVRYVIVARDPDEAIASFRPFLASHSDAWLDLWDLDRDEVVGPTFDAYISGFALPALVPRIFGFLAGWWPLRNQPNVLFVHYTELKSDRSAAIGRIASFLDFEVPSERLPAILEYTSFTWMKEHEDKFELRTVGDVPMLNPGAMIRKGRVGASAADGITREISDAIAAAGRTICGDPKAREWLYNGGELPA